FHDSQIMEDEFNFIDTKVVYLKQLIMDYSSAKFHVLELLLKSMPNLKIFSISAPDEMEMVDADRWQYLIETSLPHLHIFQFSFGYCATDYYDEKLIRLQQFQTDFWHKQHHWYTNYEIDEFLVSIY